MLTRTGCENRQRHFRAMLAHEALDAAVISDTHEIYYLTGYPPPGFPVVRYAPAMLYLETEGHSLLVARSDEGQALVDERTTYAWQTLDTINPDLMAQLARTASQQLSGRPHPRRLGWQAESLPRLLAENLAEQLSPDEWIAIDDAVAGLEKSKEPDEVALVRGAISCTLAAYDAVQEVIAPGVNELTVLQAGYSAAVLHAGEVVEYGGDFASGERGGPARNRLIAPGELYIVDAQSRYRGYWSDLARTYPAGEPTSLQREVYNHLSEILAAVPDMVEPGMRGPDLWRRLDRRIREHPHLRDSGLVHHGGHGVGLRPHEAPDINRDRDSVFEVGDVFSCEPGAYSQELHPGIRLENMFVITERSIELLSDYPHFRV